MKKYKGSALASLLAFSLALGSALAEKAAAEPATGKVLSCPINFG